MAIDHQRFGDPLFLHIYRTVINFLTVDMSSFYLDFAKDVVYIEAENDFQRRAMQTIFYQTAVALTKLLKEER